MICVYLGSKVSFQSCYNSLLVFARLFYLGLFPNIAVYRYLEGLVCYDRKVLKFEGPHIRFLSRSPFLCLRPCVEHPALRGKSRPPNSRAPTLANFLECCCLHSTSFGQWRVINHFFREIL